MPTDLPPCPAPFNLAAYVLDASGAPDARIALDLLGDTPDRWSFGRLRRTVLGTAGRRMEARSGRECEWRLPVFAGGRKADDRG